mmetsp:Transcript_7880/g.19515  ORF Transcript_7880/g.19515 Transcript_7880/m.19515 type:complete len:92 (-) Transcript_7880:417-692(-)
MRPLSEPALEERSPSTVNILAPNMLVQMQATRVRLGPNEAGVHAQHPRQLLPQQAGTGRRPTSVAKGRGHELETVWGLTPRRILGGSAIIN